MRKKSILFLTNAYPDFDSSYRGIFIKRVASYLQREGYRIFVVTPRIYKGSRCFEEQENIKVYRFPFLSGNKLLIEYETIPYLRMILYYVSGFLLTTYVILKHRCSLIHAHWAIPTGLIGALVKHILNIPYVVTIHGSDLRMAMERPGILRTLFTYVCKKSDHLNCVSEAQKGEMKQLGIDESMLSMMPMGVDDAFLEAGENRGKEPIHQPITVLSNRNLLPIYNISLLIKAIPAVLKEEHQTRFLIAGDGADKRDLETEVKRLNIAGSVEFVGRIPHDEMPSLLSRVDIYVSTSLHDGTSVSLLEAMASGAFPIVTDIPANREWIGHEHNGFLIPTNQEGSLANRIVEAIRDKDLLLNSRQTNLSIIKEKAIWPVHISKVKEIYSNILRS